MQALSCERHKTAQRTLFLLFANNNCFPMSDEKLAALFEFCRFFYITDVSKRKIIKNIDNVFIGSPRPLSHKRVPPPPFFKGWRLFKSTSPIIAITPK
jgi:hypothetical protein